MSDSFPLQFLLQVKDEMSQGIKSATQSLKGVGDQAQSTGSKVKQSGIGIGAGLSLITMNLVNTVNSVIGLKRQWEDLSRAQSNVVQSDNVLASAKAKLKVAYMNLQNAKKGEAGATDRELKEAKLQLQADLKGAKSKLAVMKAHDKYNKVLNQGGKDVDKITKKQVAYDNALRKVKNTAISNKEVHVDLQRAYQDFYLNTIPVGIGVLGSVASVMQTVKGNGISLAGSLGKLSLVGIGLGAAFLALKTNFLGITEFFQNLGRDIGNAVPALKPFLTLIESLFAAIGIGPKKAGINNAISDLMKQIQPFVDTFKNLVDNIMKGNWEGAFGVIKNAALKFWAELKQQVPLLTAVETVVNAIRAGNWKYAFSTIAAAAELMWYELKQKVPILGGVEIFIQKIQQGNWKGAFDVIAKGARDALAGIFGAETITNFITQIQQIPEKLKAAMNVPGATTWSVIDAILPTPVKQFAAIVTTWTKELGIMILDGIKAGLSFVSHTWIDPFLASLFKLETWRAALAAINPTVQAINKLILDTMFPIPGAKADPNAPKYLEIATNIFLGIGKAVHMASGIYLPEYTEANDNMIANFRKAIINGAEGWKILGAQIWNTIIDAVKSAVPFGGTLLQDQFDKLKKPIITPGLDAKEALASFGKTIKWIENQKPHVIVAVSANTSMFVAQMNNLMRNAPVGSRFRRAAGFHGIVSGPTPTLIGERGAERVDITPLAGNGSTTQNSLHSSGGSGGGSSLGNRPIIVKSQIFLDGRVIAEAVSGKITTKQAAYR